MVIFDSVTVYALLIRLHTSASTTTTIIIIIAVTRPDLEPLFY